MKGQSPPPKKKKEKKKNNLLSNLQNTINHTANAVQNLDKIKSSVEGVVNLDSLKGSVDGVLKSVPSSLIPSRKLFFKKLIKSIKKLFKKEKPVDPTIAVWKRI